MYPHASPQDPLPLLHPPGICADILGKPPGPSPRTFCAHSMLAHALPDSSGCVYSSPMLQRSKEGPLADSGQQGSQSGHCSIRKAPSLPPEHLHKHPHHNFTSQTTTKYSLVALHRYDDKSQHQR